MKLDNNLKFEDYPLNVPTEKRTLKKIEALVNELEECVIFFRVEVEYRRACFRRGKPFAEVVSVKGYVDRSCS